MVSKNLLKFCCLGILCIAVHLGCHIHHFEPNNFLNREGLMNVRSVAVLPFHNLSKSENAGVIVTNMIMAELVRSGKFHVVKYGDVRNFFLNRRMISVPAIDIDTLRALRQEFRVDMVIIGTIYRYENNEESGDRNRNKKTLVPSVMVSSSILDTRSGRILGKCEFFEKGSATGYLLTNKLRQDTFALAQKLAKKFIATIDANGV